MLGINAGHDLNLDNLSYFLSQLPQVEEVSIGHALTADAIEYGIENTVQRYLAQIQRSYTALFLILYAICRNVPHLSAVCHILPGFGEFTSFCRVLVQLAEINLPQTKEH